MDAVRRGTLPPVNTTQNASFAQALQRHARAPATAAAPHAEFRPVPADRQTAVNANVRKALTAQLANQPMTPAMRANVDELIAHAGQPDFYDVLAQKDPASAPQWKEMGRVQRQFAAAEPRYDEKTRAYSESMRLTLHTSVIQHFADPATNKGMGLYDRFIALHPTAFHQNGGWFDNLQIPLSGAMAVAQATPREMAMHLAGLVEGAFINDAPTVRAAAIVAQARRDAIGGWQR